MVVYTITIAVLFFIARSALITRHGMKLVDALYAHNTRRIDGGDLSFDIVETYAEIRMGLPKFFFLCINPLRWTSRQMFPQTWKYIQGES